MQTQLSRDSHDYGASSAHSREGMLPEAAHLARRPSQFTWSGYKNERHALESSNSWYVHYSLEYCI